jgi:hypothetical protein
VPREAGGDEQVHVVDTTKFAIGIVFALVGAVVLISARRSRGFGQRKQAGSLFLIGAVLFLAVGLGLVDI